MANPRIALLVVLLITVFALSCADRQIKDVEFSPEFQPVYCAEDSIAATVRSMAEERGDDTYELRLLTSEEFSCFNYEIYFDLKLIENYILVSVQKVNRPQVCLEAIGPATGSDTLSLTPGTYTLQVRYCDPKWPEVRYDMYRLEVEDGDGILIREKVVYQMSVWR